MQWNAMYYVYIMYQSICGVAVQKINEMYMLYSMLYITCYILYVMYNGICSILDVISSINYLSIERD